MNEPSHSEPQKPKNSMLMEKVKEELIVVDGLKEEPYEVEFEAVKDFKEEGISENVIQQIQCNQVSIVKGPQDSLIISPETRIVPVENNVTDGKTLKWGTTSVCSQYSCDLKGEMHFKGNKASHGKFSLLDSLCSQNHKNCKKNHELPILTTTSKNLCRYSDNRYKLKHHKLTHSCSKKIKVHDQNIKQFKCSDCDYECNRKIQLKQHILTHSNIKQFKCPDCDHECNQKSYLKQHMLTHSSIKQFKCSSCDYKCNRKTQLKQHMLTHSNIKRFKCSECDYRCKQKINLNYHMFTHSKIKLFKCSICDFECNRKGNLKMHMLIHSNVKQFGCSDCNYVCNLKSDLNRHMSSVHSNVKQFKCSNCDYECNRKSHLRRHILTHSNIREFRCSECDFGCNQKSNLKQHILTHSNVKQFRCSICDYECNRKSHLQRHMLTHSSTYRGRNRKVKKQHV